VAGLGRKVADIRGSLQRVKAAPLELLAREELRRKLHALSSSAKLMKFDAMDRAIAEALGLIDRTAIDQPLDRIDLAQIEQVIKDLPALAWGDGHACSSRVQATEKVTAAKYSVLIVGSPLMAEALLDDEGNTGAHATFTCESTPDAHAAYDLVRTTEPDLVLLDADLSGSAELVASLMDDPLTEAVPIVVVGSFLEAGEAAKFVAMGVAKTVSKPTSREALRAVCEETLSPDHGAVAAQAMLGEPTLEELGERLAAELKEAIVGRADPAARTHRIPLGQGTEVLGAVWGAIARVREVITSRTDGHVRFAGGPEGALTPAPLLHVPDVARSDRMRTRRELAAEVRLSGRRVVVADDDPGVVWFLADLLKTAGCVVHEAFDGQQALEVAYKTSPDLVISDILMPKLDGFSLCRALRRDVALRDTPVILLSWKEDLLQRVRELGAGAAGYVRKESDTRAIIARVREALRVRGRIEARLRDEGEVRGRLDGVSIRTLLEIVCATRPEARVSVRDATFLYEVEIRWGAPHRATRTDGDGAFLRGSKVLTHLLGVSAGRFTVTTSTSPIENELDGNLAAQLAKPIARARAAMSLLTGPQVHAISRVRLDEESLFDYLKATPERARLVARRLANGAPPRELVACGSCEPALLDDLLCDLAARGLVTGVEGANGEDLLGPAFAALIEHTDARAALAPRMGTPSPLPALTDALYNPAPCTPDAPAAQRVSPTPGPASSLEDAVLREVIHRSPEPAQAASLSPPPSAIVDPQSLRPRNSPPPPAVDEEYGTPPAEQILALGEPTIIDDTVYAERSASIPPPGIDDADEDEDVAPADEAEKNDLTPFASVTSEEPTPVPPAKKKWPMVAFIAATGVVAWAVLHFSTATGSAPLMQNQTQPPPAETTLPAPQTRSTPPADEPREAAAKEATPAAAENGAAAPDAVAPTDGKERARGAATPARASEQEARARKPAADERGCTIDAHSSRVAHVKF
jgi:DNA-binding response OmpR family regulator